MSAKVEAITEVGDVRQRCVSLPNYFGHLLFPSPSLVTGCRKGLFTITAYELN